MALFGIRADKLGVKMLLFEGGKSIDINEEITQQGMEGAKRVLEHLVMLNPRKKAEPTDHQSIYIEKIGLDSGAVFGNVPRVY